MAAFSTSRPYRGLSQFVRLGLVAGLCLATGTLSAQNKQSGPFDDGEPVNYAADRIELQDKAQRVYLSGNVDVTQGNLRMQAERTVVFYIDNNGIKIQRMDAAGHVIVNRGDESATGDLATYDFNARTITMVGNVTLRRGRDVSNAERLVIDLENHHSSLTSHSKGGRVYGQFEVPKKEGPATPAASKP